MKKLFVVTVIMVFAAGLYAQGDLDNAFYFRMGYSKPTKTYWGVDDKSMWDDYDVKRNGFVFELGQMFYFNSLKMADGLRLGLNADYISFYYHGIKAEDSDDKLGHILFGSKIGPVLSYSPVDKLVFDGYVKLNPVWVSSIVEQYEEEDNDVWLGFMGVGYSFGFNVRYSILMVGFDFNRSWNKLQYLDEDDGLESDITWGNWGDDDGDEDKDYTPMPSFNITIGLAF
ncbi:MAG: hypothetical protein JXB24_08835 [Bacteroidales bacterium]|nr:hypothetical protein [Bacteroidales bacterium]